MNEPFPTGKNTVSYSEVSTWASCAYRHKLAFIDKIAIEQNWIHAKYGTALHKGVENYLKNKVLDLEAFSLDLKDVWEKENYPDYETWNSWGTTCLSALPEWMDSQFPDWELVGVELRLEENIPQEDQIKFKGFIDCIIRVPLNKEKTKWKTWIIDWKTAGARGWDREKRSDELVLSQLYLYKSYIMQMFGGESREIGTAFVIMKKGSKKEKCIDFIPVSSGPKSMEKANKMVSSMIASVRKGKSFKNKYACKWCPYADTAHCTR
jgi:hypothetical protein